MRADHPDEKIPLTATRLAERGNDRSEPLGVLVIAEVGSDIFRPHHGIDRTCFRDHEVSVGRRKHLGHQG